MYLFSMIHEHRMLPVYPIIEPIMVFETGSKILLNNALYILSFVVMISL